MKKLLTCLLVFIFPLLIPASLRAGSSPALKIKKQGQAAYKAHNYPQAMKLYLQAAALGNSDAQVDIGYFYQNGLSVDQSYPTAMEWYQKAAAAKNHKAMANIGYLYEYGLGVDQDYQAAMKWYQKAAALKDSIGTMNVGDLYKNGKGVVKDGAEAAKWFRQAKPLFQKAALNGDSESQDFLGLFYLEGDGVPPNNAEGRKWILKAAAQGYVKAEYTMGFIYFQGKGVIRDYKTALYWYKKAARHGNSGAENSIGWFYQNGFVVPKDIQKAIDHYLKSAAKDNTVAQNNLGDLYYRGTGVKKDYDKALDWYKKAAKKNDPYAETQIGYFYVSGYGVPHDYQEAMRWLLQASDKGNAFAQAEIGYLYESGVGAAQGIKADREQALEWYQKADDNGSRYARSRLVAMGNGTPGFHPRRNTSRVLVIEILVFLVLFFLGFILRKFKLHRLSKQTFELNKTGITRIDAKGERKTVLWDEMGKLAEDINGNYVTLYDQFNKPMLVVGKPNGDRSFIKQVYAEFDKRHVPSKAQSMVFSMPPRVRRAALAIGILFTLLLLVTSALFLKVLIAPSVTDRNPFVIMVAMGICSCVFLGYLIYAFMVYFKFSKSKIEVTSEGIARLEKDDSRVFIRWDDVERINRRQRMRQIAIYSRTDSEKIMVDYQFERFDDLQDRIFEEYEERFQMPALPVIYGLVMPEWSFLLFIACYLFFFLGLGLLQHRVLSLIPMSFFLLVIYVLNMIFVECRQVKALTLDSSGLTLFRLFDRVVLPWQRVEKIGLVSQLNRGGRFFQTVLATTEGGRYKFSRTLGRNVNAFTAVKKYLDTKK